YVPLAERAGADAAVVPRLITDSTLLKLARRGEVVQLSLMEEGRAAAVGLVVGAGSRADGERLEDLPRVKGGIGGASVRGDEVMVPEGATPMRAQDVLVLCGGVEALDRVQDLFRG